MSTAVAAKTWPKTLQLFAVARSSPSACHINFYEACTPLELQTKEKGVNLIWGHLQHDIPSTETVFEREVLGQEANYYNQKLISRIVSNLSF